MSDVRGDAFSDGMTFLSIREVLDELVGEFDDITISKIRFLESRGLIHPERTPSGYRKFFPGDVERLRWILRQQREHFLPLKVIKRRLDLGDGLAPELPDSPSLFDEQAEVEKGHPLSNIVSNIRHARPSNDGESDKKLKEPNASRVIVNDQVVVDDSMSSLYANEGRPLSKPHLATVPPTSARDGSLEVPPEHGVRQNHPSQLEPASEEETSTESHVEAEAGDHLQRSSEHTTSLSQGHSYLVDEFAHELGTSIAAVAELEEFGFISRQNVAGTPCFDDDALEVSRAIVALRSYGLEPRHLKSVRNAAERDATVYGQIVAPLLRQRSPALRERGERELEELADRGVSLYERILRREIPPTRWTLIWIERKGPPRA